MKPTQWTAYKRVGSENGGEAIVRLARYSYEKRKWHLEESRELRGKEAEALVETLEKYLEQK